MVLDMVGGDRELLGSLDCLLWLEAMEVQLGLGRFKASWLLEPRI